MKVFAPVVFALLMAVLSVSAVSGQQDIEPPTLLDVQFSPSEIDTSSGPVTVTVSIHVMDDLSGVGWVYFSFRKPGTTQGIGIDIVPGTDWGILTEGDNLNGHYQNTMVLPRYSAYGEWELSYVAITDNVGNRTDTYKPENQIEAKDSNWPSLFNNFNFQVGTAEQQQPAARLFIPWTVSR